MAPKIVSPASKASQHIDGSQSARSSQPHRPDHAKPDTTGYRRTAFGSGSPAQASASFAAGLRSGSSPARPRLDAIGGRSDTRAIRAGNVASKVSKFSKMKGVSLAVVQIKEGGFDFDKENPRYQEYLLQNEKNPFEIELEGINKDEAFEYLFELKGTASRAAVVASRRFMDPDKDAMTLSSKTFIKRRDAFILGLLEGTATETPNVAPDKKYTPADLALFLLNKKVVEGKIDLTNLPKSAAEVVLNNELNLIIGQIRYFLQNQSLTSTQGITRSSNNLEMLLNPIKQTYQEQLNATLGYPQLVWKSQKEAATRSGAKWNRRTQSMTGGGIHFALLQPARAEFDSQFLTGGEKEDLRTTVLARWQSVALESFEARLKKLKSNLKSINPSKSKSLRVPTIKFDGGTGEGKTFLTKLIEKYYGVKESSKKRTQDSAVTIDFIDLNTSAAKIQELLAIGAQNGKIAGINATTAIKCVMFDELFFQGEEFLKHAGIVDASDLDKIEDEKEKFIKQLGEKGVLIVVAGATEHPEIYKIAAIRNARKIDAVFNQMQNAQDAAYRYEKVENAIDDARMLLEGDDRDGAERLLRKVFSKEIIKEIFLSELTEKSGDELEEAIEDIINATIKDILGAQTKDSQDAIKLILERTDKLKKPFVELLETFEKEVESRKKKMVQKESVETRIKDKREFAKDKISQATFVQPVEGIDKYQDLSSLVDDQANSSTLYVVPDISAKSFGEADFNKVCAAKPCIVVVPYFKNEGRADQELGYKILYKHNGQFHTVTVDKQPDGSLPVDKKCQEIERSLGLTIPRIIIYDNTTSVGGDTGGLALGIKKIIIQCDTENAGAYKKSLDDAVQFIGRDRDDDKTKLEVAVVSNQTKEDFVAKITENTTTQDASRIEAYFKNKKHGDEARSDGAKNLHSTLKELGEKERELTLGSKGREEQAEADRLEAEERHRQELAELAEEDKKSKLELELAKASQALEREREEAEKRTRGQRESETREAQAKLAATQREREIFEQEDKLRIEREALERQQREAQEKLEAARLAAEQKAAMARELAAASALTQDVEHLSDELLAILKQEELATAKIELLAKIPPIKAFVAKDLVSLYAKATLLIASADLACEKFAEAEGQTEVEKLALVALKSKIDSLRTITNPKDLTAALEAISKSIDEAQDLTALDPLKKQINAKDREAKTFKTTISNLVDGMQGLIDQVNQLAQDREQAAYDRDLATSKAALTQKRREEAAALKASLAKARALEAAKQELLGEVADVEGTIENARELLLGNPDILRQAIAIKQELEGNQTGEEFAEIIATLEQNIVLLEQDRESEISKVVDALEAIKKTIAAADNEESLGAATRKQEIAEQNRAVTDLHENIASAQEGSLNAIEQAKSLLQSLAETNRAAAAVKKDQTSADARKAKAAELDAKLAALKSRAQEQEAARQQAAGQKEVDQLLKQLVADKKALGAGCLAVSETMENLLPIYQEMLRNEGVVTERHGDFDDEVEQQETGVLEKIAEAKKYYEETQAKIAKDLAIIQSFIEEEDPQTKELLEEALENSLRHRATLVSLLERITDLHTQIVAANDEAFGVRQEDEELDLEALKAIKFKEAAARVKKVVTAVTAAPATTPTAKPEPIARPNTAERKFGRGLDSALAVVAEIEFMRKEESDKLIKDSDSSTRYVASEGERFGAAHLNEDKTDIFEQRKKDGQANAIFKPLVTALAKIDACLKSSKKDNLMEEIWNKKAILKNPYALSAAEKFALVNVALQHEDSADFWSEKGDAVGSEKEDRAQFLRDLDIGQSEYKDGDPAKASIDASLNILQGLGVDNIKTWVEQKVAGYTNAEPTKEKLRPSSPVMRPESAAKVRALAQRLDGKGLGAAIEVN